jgi:hypothetical protein
MRAGARGTLAAAADLSSRTKKEEYAMVDSAKSQPQPDVFVAWRWSHDRAVGPRVVPAPRVAPERQPAWLAWRWNKQAAQKTLRPLRMAIANPAKHRTDG